jgi:hypothetical protein
VSWSEETIRKVQAHDGTLAIVRGAVFGLPGFGPYRGYLDELVSAVKAADAQSTVRITVDS